MNLLSQIAERTTAVPQCLYTTFYTRFCLFHQKSECSSRLGDSDSSVRASACMGVCTCMSVCVCARSLCSVRCCGVRPSPSRWILCAQCSRSENFVLFVVVVRRFVFIDIYRSAGMNRVCTAHGGFHALPAMVTSEPNFHFFSVFFSSSLSCRCCCCCCCCCSGMCRTNNRI